jgi:GntR family transcriptional repressor for pyruvate dehydrogenase complex
MEFKRIQSKKVYELVAEQIENMIKTNQINPGDQLDSVEQLAKNFNVSRSTIREALSALKAMGYIDVKQGEGTFVKERDDPFSMITLPQQLDRASLLEFLEVRKIMESNAAAIAASKRTESDLKKMQDSLHTMENSLREERAKGGRVDIEADVHFHRVIAEATHNSVLIQMMNQMSEALYHMIHNSRQQWLSDSSTIKRLYHEHCSIYKAIEDQNATLAQQLMLAHLVKVEQGLQLFGRS